LSPEIIENLKSINKFLIKYDYQGKTPFQVYNAWAQIENKQITDPDDVIWIFSNISKFIEWPKEYIVAAAKIDNIIKEGINGTK